MNMRRSGSIAGNPILIGAATILVSVVAVFLAYNANEGLPFVPKYTLTAQVPNAAALVKGNEVKIGGSRVGIVTGIRPKTWPDGRVTALIDMQLDKKIEPIPSDSTVEIRPVSPLGLKFVDLRRGTSPDGLVAGDTMPLASATPLPVQIDEIFNMFDEPTRVASSANLIEFGNAIAGRGLDLNQTIRNLQPLLTNLTPVMTRLSDPQTGLQKLFPAFDQTASQTAPVAEEQASLFRGLADTFTALASVTDSIQATIQGAAPALEAAIASFPVQRPFLTNSATFFNTLTPGVTALANASPTLQVAVAAGAKPDGGLANAYKLNENLSTLLLSLQTFLLSPDTKGGVKRLISTVETGNPIVTYAAPVQTTCNYISILLRNAGGIASNGFNFGSGAGAGGGTTLRAMPVVAGWGAPPTTLSGSKWGSNEIGGSSSSYANGPTDLNSGIGTNYLHVNGYPFTGAPQSLAPTPDGKASCQAGNENFAGEFKQCEQAVLTSTKRPGDVHSAYDPNAGTKTEKTTIPKAPPGK
ncbi:MAG: MlaD family protein [Actinomycetes bacterium]